MNSPSQQQVEPPDRGSFIQRLLTADIAVLFGALIGLGIVFRRNEIDNLGRTALIVGVGAVIGFVISLFLRTVNLRTRLIALAVIVLVALPVVGVIAYGAL